MLVKFPQELHLKELLTSGLPHEVTSQRSDQCRITQIERKIWISTSCVFRVGDIFRVTSFVAFLCYKLYGHINVFHEPCGISRADKFLFFVSHFVFCFVVHLAAR